MPRGIVTDNGSALIDDAFKGYLKANGMHWKPVSTFAPQENGRAEHMVVTMKRAIAKVVQSTAKDCNNVIGAKV